MSETVKVDLTMPEAHIPFSASVEAAAYDLCSAEDWLLAPGERKVFNTGLRLELPKHHAGLILPRSGMAVKDGVTILNSPGLIDPDYRGEVGVCLINLGSEHVGIVRGQRIAQLMVVHSVDVLFCLERLSLTERGEGGWGSTGR